MANPEQENFRDAILWQLEVCAKNFDETDKEAACITRWHAAWIKACTVTPVDEKLDEFSQGYKAAIARTEFNWLATDSWQLGYRMAVREQFSPQEEREFKRIYGVTRL